MVVDKGHADGCRLRDFAQFAPEGRRDALSLLLEAGHEVLKVIDRAIGAGFLAAAPSDQACAWCDFRDVCGPDVARRVRRKPPEPLADLVELRRRP